MKFWRWNVLVGLALALLACSPTLNWREVRLDRLSALLPCKPDKVQRSVSLGAQMLVLDMAGCEAGGGLFALSHTQVPDVAHVGETLTAWRAATLGNMHSSGVSEHVLHMASNTAPGATAVLLHAMGQRTDGSAVQAQLTWFADGLDIYHLAVYANKVSPEMAETLFTQATVSAKQP